MPSDVPTDMSPLGGEPPTADRFLFEVKGVEIGIFREVSGLQVTVEVVEVQEGGQNAFSHKLPARMSWPNIVFKRGLTQSDALFQWLQESSGEGYAANNNSLERPWGAITAIGSDGSRLRTWEFIDVFAVRWKGPDFSAGSTDVLDEELEIAHHGFRAQAPGAAS